MNDIRPWLGVAAMVAIACGPPLDDLDERPRAGAEVDAGQPRSDPFDGGLSHGDGGPSADAGPLGDGGPRGDGGGALDAGGEPDAGADGGLVEVFVAQGALGRFAVSCDDGRSWLRNQSDDDTAVCYGTYPDGGTGPNCDHSNGAPKGLVAHGGALIAAFGHGPPGSVRRSLDGRTWSVVLPGYLNPVGVGSSGGAVVAINGRASVSTDEGASWSDAGPTLRLPDGGGLGFPRRVGFGPAGLVVLSGDNGIAVSHDLGLSTAGPQRLPTSCGVNGGIVGGPTSVVMLNPRGPVCVSDDRGLTWQAIELPTRDGGLAQELQFVDQRYVAYGRDRNNRPLRLVSPDGHAWSAQPVRFVGLDGGVVTPAPTLSAIARGPTTGTWVAVSQSSYAGQLFLRSSDGLDWRVLPPSDYVASHPIGTIVPFMAPSSACR